MHGRVMLLPSYVFSYYALLKQFTQPHNYPTRTCAARGKVIKFVLLSVFLSVFLQKNVLRWHELATFRTSECIRRFENAPIYLPVPATGLTRSHSLGFLLFSFYPVHFVSHFIYGHQSRPQITCHVYTYIYAHARAQQLTLHSGRAGGVRALVSSS